MIILKCVCIHHRHLTRGLGTPTASQHNIFDSEQPSQCFLVNVALNKLLFVERGARHFVSLRLNIFFLKQLISGENYTISVNQKIMSPFFVPIGIFLLLHKVSDRNPVKKPIDYSADTIFRAVTRLVTHSMTTSADFTWWWIAPSLVERDATSVPRLRRLRSTFRFVSNKLYGKTVKGMCGLIVSLNSPSFYGIFKF